MNEIGEVNFEQLYKPDLVKVTKTVVRKRKLTEMLLYYLKGSVRNFQKLK